MESTKKRLARNTLFLYVLTFSNYFIGLLLYPYISRVLSVEGFGLVGFSMAYVLLFQVIVEFGFMISATATVAKYRTNSDKVAAIVSTTMYAKLILTLISTILFLASALFVPMLREHLMFVSLFFISAVLSAMMPDFFFRGIEKMKTIAIRTVLVRSLSLSLVLLFVRDDSQIILVPVSFITGNLLALVITLIAIYREGIPLRRAAARDAIISLKESVLFFLSRLATSINQSLGAFVLGIKYSPSSYEMGIFSGAARISMASEMMLPPLTDSIYPHMVNKKDYALFYKVLAIGTIAWMLVCLFAFTFAEIIVTLILGSEYIEASKYLRVLLLGNFLAFPNMMLGYNALTPLGKANHANIAIMISAGLNIAIYSLMWLTGSISILSVTIVMTLSNLLMLLYRGSVFIKYRHLSINN